MYEGAQSRKVRPFQGFKRKAVVVLPSDEIYQQRLAERQKTLKKSVHPDAILEMKGAVRGARSQVTGQVNEAMTCTCQTLSMS